MDSTETLIQQIKELEAKIDKLKSINDDQFMIILSLQKKLLFYEDMERVVRLENF